MQRKPFNLEEAIAGKHCVTRDGTKVTEIHYFKSCEKSRPVVAVIDRDLFFFSIDGKMNKTEYEYDLFMAEEEKEMCLICTTFSAREEEKLCNDCLNVRDRLLIFELAKRIKALEEKLK